MSRVCLQSYWRELAASAACRPSRGIDRLDLLRWLVVAGTLVVMARLVALELAYGERFRQTAVRPVVSGRTELAARPRILARDGTVLAADSVVPALAVHYRYLEEPPNEAWLASRARSRLPPRMRRQPAAVADETARLRRQHAEARAALARACGMQPADFFARARAIQRRVQAMQAVVQTPQQRPSGLGPTQRTSPAQGGWLRHLAALWHRLREPTPQNTVTFPLAEELWYHVICERLTLEAVAEIEAHPERYPGALILHVAQREYPCGACAAHVVGYAVTAAPGAAGPGAFLTPPPAASCGVMGAEQLLDSLRGSRPAAGLARRQSPAANAGPGTDMRSPHAKNHSHHADDLVLTLHPALQQRAHGLLEAAARRRVATSPAGGALVLVAAETGEILACTSWPAFEPSLRAEIRAGPSTSKLAPAPLDRALKAARPANAVLAPVFMAALFERGATQEAKMSLRSGRPEELCARADADRVLDWAKRCGFGAATGIELSGEVQGVLPLPAQMLPSGGRAVIAQAAPLARGRTTARVTPLQVARLMCACANGGRLVRLHIVRNSASVSAWDNTPAKPGADHMTQQISVLPGEIVSAVRRVLDEHAAVSPEHIQGSMEFVCLVDRPPRSPGPMWLAGYAPVRRPRVAFALLLEQDETPVDALRTWLHRLCLEAIHTLDREHGM